MARRAQDGLHEVRGRRLAVGPGDPDEAKRSAGMSEEAGGQARQSRTGVGHPDDGDSGRDGHSGRVALDDDGRRPAPHRVADERVAVLLEAADAHEQPARRRGARIVADAGDVDVGGAGNLRPRHLGEQLA